VTPSVLFLCDVLTMTINGFIFTLLMRRVDNNGLTIKQEKFVRKYLECGNASEAYRCAYNCKKMSDNAVYREASLLLDNPMITQRCEYLKNHLAEASGITALSIIKEHQKIAFSDATKLRNGWMSLKEFESLSESERAAVKSIETREVKRVTAEGEEIVNTEVKVTMYDKQKSLESICRMLGYNAPEKIEHSGKVGIEQITGMEVI